MRKLDEVFVVEVLNNPDAMDKSHKDNYVTLAPKLANYRGILSYDHAGNANITIIRNDDDEVMLDASLDNGEINQIDMGWVL